MRRLQIAWAVFIEGAGERLMRWLIMPLYQAWLWGQERLSGAFWLLVGLIFIAAGVGSAFWMYHRQIGTITNPELLDFLQVAANVANGKGMTTFVLRPLALSPDFAQTAVPDLYHPPLSLLVWGALFALLGRVSEQFSVYLAGLLIGLTAAGLFFLASRLLNRWAGVLAAGLFLLSPLTLLSGGVGQPATLAAALFLVWFTVMARTKVWSRPTAVIGGLLLGLAGLAQGLTLLAAPIVAFNKRWQSWGNRLWFVAALLLVLLPYSWRNYRQARTPFNPLKTYAFLLDTRPFRGDSIYRHAFSELPSPFLLSAQNLPAIARKSRLNFPRLSNAWISWGWLPILFALCSLLFWRRWQNSPLRLTIGLFFGTGILTALILLLTRPMPEAIFFLLPIACFLTAATIAALAEKVRAWNRWQQLPIPLWLQQGLLPTVLVLGLLAGQSRATLRLMQSLTPVRLNPTAQVAQMVQALVPGQKTLLASDEPRLLAFYLRRPIVWTPCHREDWERLKLLDRITHIALSPTALLQVGGNADSALRLTFIFGNPFLDRFYPTMLRSARYLLPVPLLITGKFAPNHAKLKPAPDPYSKLTTDQLVVQGLKLFEQKRWQEAEKFLVAAVRRKPSAANFFYLGNVWIERKKWINALQAFQAALGESPGSFAAANNMAWTYAKMHEELDLKTNVLPFAEQWAEYALRYAPPDPKILAQILDTAGWVDFLRGRTTGKQPAVRWRLKRALKRLHYAYQILPDNPLINLHLAMVYTELGQTEKAQQFLEKAKK